MTHPNDSRPSDQARITTRPTDEDIVGSSTLHLSPTVDAPADHGVRAGTDSPTGRPPGGGPAGIDLKPGRSRITLVVTMAVLVGSTIGIFLVPEKQMVGILAMVLMLSLIFLRMPVAMAMIIPALLGMWALRGFRLVESTLADVPFRSIAQWTLSVIPMFILMGLLLWRAGLTTSIYAAARHWLGWLPGGLAVGTNLAGAGLASVSGSSVGTTFALTRIGMPEMLKAGYDKRLAIGSVLVAGLPGQLIPPSIMLVLYAGIAEVPVGPQLLAGIGPGVLVAIFFTVTLIGFAIAKPEWAGRKKDHQAPDVRSTWNDRFRSMLAIWPIPILIALIVFGMFSGVFTATEAGAVAALFSMVITLIWKRKDRPWRAVADSAVSTVSSVGAIFFMLLGVDVLSRMLTLTGLSTAFADWIKDLDMGRVQFLLLMMVIYILLGTFMEPLPMMVLTVPLLLPTLETLDVSLLWFGVFAVFMGELAVVSPPVGILAFIVHGIVQDPEVNQGQKITMKDIFVASGWFLPMAILFTVVLILFPQVSTFIPDLMIGNE